MPMRTLPWLLLSVVLPAQDQPPVRLAHALAPGSNFSFTIAVENQLQFDDPRKDSRTSFELAFAATCGKAEGASVPVTCVLRRLRAKIAAPNANVAYDSAQEDPPTGPLRKLTDLVDAKFDLTVATDGTIAAVQVPSPLDEALTEQIGTDFRSLFSAYFVRLPSEPMVAGASWDCSTLLFGEQPGQGPAKTHLVLASVDDGIARIDLAYEAPKPPPRPGVRFELRESSGRIEFDVAAGRVRTSSSVLLARATRTAAGKDVSATSRLEVRAALLPPGTDARSKDWPAPDDERPKDDARPGR